MKKTNLIARTIAKVALIAVKEASRTASWYGSYQPKEPKKLNEYINKRKTK
ncbi:cyclic lactone autoinducer peptide [Ruminococcus sp.]|uniref:cyclic lactone autoinducer peptide n=1 Tax=Ruminococcus sp. TaxID=41978 RepID=UPI003AF4DA65